MRRNDREITDFSEIVGIIDRCDCCRLGLLDRNEAYIVPMNFGYDTDNDRLTLYFHSAADGRKIELIARPSTVSFEMDTNHELVRGTIGCAFSFRYQCVMGTGSIAVLTDPNEKRFGMGKIMEHYTGKSLWNFRDDMLDKTAVLKLSVDSLSCKAY